MKLTTANKIVKIITIPSIIGGVLVFWDLWCGLFYVIALETCDPNPGTYLIINPMWHLGNLLR